MSKMFPTRARLILTATLGLALLVPASAEAKKSKWALARKPATGVALAIGGYSAGCVQGAQRLPGKGLGYQAMRPSRHRDFGHPVLISYIKTIAKRIKRGKLGPLLVGDLGQAKGGPSPHGHASHQSGLDVDLWYWHPTVSEQRLLTRKERESLGARSVVDAKSKGATSAWSSSLPKLLSIAASQPQVARIFVNPLIKKRLCEQGKLEESVLRVLRPWYGHADHMHVRLQCPADSVSCEKQKELPPGDGCQELDWWLDEKAQAARREKRKSYKAKVGATPELPQQCMELLER